MKASDLNLYNELMRRINLRSINPIFCGCKWCDPQCQEYEVRLFSKVFKLEIIFTNDIVTISSRSINYSEIVFRLSEIDFYNRNIDLLN
jgi:hypothetical protein